MAFMCHCWIVGEGLSAEWSVRDDAGAPGLPDIAITASFSIAVR